MKPLWCFDSHALAVQSEGLFVDISQWSWMDTQVLPFQQKLIDSLSSCCCSAWFLKGLPWEASSFSTSSAPFPSKPIVDSVADFSSSIRWLLLKAWDTPLCPAHQSSWVVDFKVRALISGLQKSKWLWILGNKCMQHGIHFWNSLVTLMLKIKICRKIPSTISQNLYA